MKARERLLLDCAAAGLAFGLRWWRPIRRELELLGNLVNTERGMVTEIKMSDIFCWLPHSVTIVEGAPIYHHGYYCSVSYMGNKQKVLMYI